MCPIISIMWQSCCWNYYIFVMFLKDCCVYCLCVFSSPLTHIPVCFGSSHTSSLTNFTLSLLPYPRFLFYSVIPSPSQHLVLLPLFFLPLSSPLPVSPSLWPMPSTPSATPLSSAVSQALEATAKMRQRPRPFAISGSPLPAFSLTRHSWNILLILAFLLLLASDNLIEIKCEPLWD